MRRSASCRSSLPCARRCPGALSASSPRLRVILAVELRRRRAAGRLRSALRLRIGAASGLRRHGDRARRRAAAARSRGARAIARRAAACSAASAVSRSRCRGRSVPTRSPICARSARRDSSSRSLRLRCRGCVDRAWRAGRLRRRRCARYAGALLGDLHVRRALARAAFRRCRRRSRAAMHPIARIWATRYVRI